MDIQLNFLLEGIMTYGKTEEPPTQHCFTQIGRDS